MSALMDEIQDELAVHGPETQLQHGVGMVLRHSSHAAESALCILASWVFQDPTASEQLKCRAEALLTAVDAALGCVQ